MDGDRGQQVVPCRRISIASQQDNKPTCQPASPPLSPTAVIVKSDIPKLTFPSHATGAAGECLTADFCAVIVLRFGSMPSDRGSAPPDKPLSLTWIFPAARARLRLDVAPNFSY